MCFDKFYTMLNIGEDVIGLFMANGLQWNLGQVYPYAKYCGKV